MRFYRGEIMKPNYIAKKSVFAKLSLLKILLCLLIIPLIVLIFQIIILKKFRIEFYDDKIITYSGWLNVTRKQMTFMGVVFTTVHQSMIGQIFNYGNVNVDCVGTWDVDLTYIKKPKKLEEYLRSKIISVPTTNQFIHV